MVALLLVIAWQGRTSSGAVQHQKFRGSDCYGYFLPWRPDLIVWHLALKPENSRSNLTFNCSRALFASSFPLLVVSIWHILSRAVRDLAGDWEDRSVWPVALARIEGRRALERQAPLHSCKKQHFGQCMLWDEHILETECKTTYGWEIILGRHAMRWDVSRTLADLRILAQQDFTGAKNGTWPSQCSWQHPSGGDGNSFSFGIWKLQRRPE